MEKPLVSVIMPVYNGEKYIGKAIESVLAQNVPTELLVIDDCSTDKTELTVMKYMDNGNIRYIRNKENMGAARSRNRGVKLQKENTLPFWMRMTGGKRASWKHRQRLWNRPAVRSAPPEES